MAEITANLVKELEQQKLSPIAEIRPLPAREMKPRPIGLARGRFTVPPSFFEPLPDHLQDAFEGRPSS